MIVEVFYKFMSLVPAVRLNIPEIPGYLKTKIEIKKHDTDF